MGQCFGMTPERTALVSRSRGDGPRVSRVRDRTTLPDSVDEPLLRVECEALAVGDLRMLIAPRRRAPPAFDPIAERHEANDRSRLWCKQTRLAQRPLT